MTRSTQAQRAERVTAAQELLARGTSMAEAAVALSRDFGLSRRQAYRYLEAAQGVVPAPAIAETSVTITLRIPRNIVRELLWRQWQNGPNRFKELRRRGVPKFNAAVAAGSPTGFWRMSGHPAVQQALRNHSFDLLDLPRLHVPAQA
jgi:hypothetical protein